MEPGENPNTTNVTLYWSDPPPFATSFELRGMPTGIILSPNTGCQHSPEDATIVFCDFGVSELKFPVVGTGFFRARVFGVYTNNLATTKLLPIEGIDVIIAPNTRAYSSGSEPELVVYSPNLEIALEPLSDPLTYPVSGGDLYLLERQLLSLLDLFGLPLHLANDIILIAYVILCAALYAGCVKLLGNKFVGYLFGGVLTCALWISGPVFFGIPYEFMALPVISVAAIGVVQFNKRT